MKNKKFPILEFDPTQTAVIEPSDHIESIDMPDRCVVCFFQEVIDKLNEKNRLQKLADIETEMGKLPVYELELASGKEVTVFQPGIGAPLSAGMIEEVIALGGKKFIACGGAGVLKKNIAVGNLIIPNSAVRDEGVSYHYIEPGRTLKPSKKALRSIEEVLTDKNIDYVLGKTWTTSSFYRETPDKVSLRREEGCLTVEMESAAFFAVAQFRGVEFAQILYGGDDVSGEFWDKRDWSNRKTIREEIFWLAVESVLNI